MNLKHQICDLFEVHDDEKGVYRVVTPLEYSGTGDRIVVRVRPRGDTYQIDENGDAAFYASLSGGDAESESVMRWVEQLPDGVSIDEDETLSATTQDPSLVAPLIFRIAESAQQLYTVATSKAARGPSDFKDRVIQVVLQVAKQLHVDYHENVELEIAGGLLADVVLEARTPLIVIAASSTARLLEAEVIHLQYRHENREGFVLAVAESPEAVTKKQFLRANYYTGKTVSFDRNALTSLVQSHVHLH